MYNTSVVWSEKRIIINYENNLNTSMFNLDTIDLSRYGVYVLTKCRKPSENNATPNHLTSFQCVK